MIFLLKLKCYFILIPEGEQGNLRKASLSIRGTHVVQNEKEP